MTFFLNFIFGILIVCIGAAGIKFNHKIVNTFGRNNWFERKLGPGTTYPLFQLLSILVIFFGFMMMISLHDNLLEFLLTPLTSLLDR